VIRDLTLRSAASFGSFHLIRLLYDEYMFYLIEHRVAHATGETPIAVMGDLHNYWRFLSKQFIGLGHKAWREGTTNKTPNTTANGNHANHAHSSAAIQKIVLFNSAGASNQNFGSSSGGTTSHNKRLKTN